MRGRVRVRVRGRVRGTVRVRVVRVQSTPKRRCVASAHRDPSAPRPASPCMYLVRVRVRVRVRG